MRYALSLIISIIMFMLVLSPVCSQVSDFNVSLSIASPTCYDGFQNQNETGIDCGGPCSACQDHGGGGSGGHNGGGSTPGGGSPAGTYVFYVGNSSISAVFNSSEGNIYSAEIFFKGSRQNVTLYIEEVDREDLPSVPDWPSPGFFKISLSNAQKEDIAKVRLRVMVPYSSLGALNVPVKSITLMQYDGAWKLLETSFDGSDGYGYIFSAQGKDLGLYGIRINEADTPHIAAGQGKRFNIFEETPGFFMRREIDWRRLGLFSAAGIAVIAAMILAITGIRKFRLSQIVKDGLDMDKLQEVDKNIEELDKKIKS